MLLLNFIKSIFSSLINRVIEEGEHNIVRCVVYPIHFNKKLQKPLFTPPPNSNDVSLIRLKYTDETRAKSDGLQIAELKKVKLPNATFSGFAVINYPILNLVKQTVDIPVTLVGTPMDKNGKCINENVKAFRIDRGKPYHADLIYNKSTPDGEPNTKIREFADKLTKVISEKNLFFADTCPTSKKWCGIKIPSSFDF